MRRSKRTLALFYSLVALEMVKSTVVWSAPPDVADSPSKKEHQASEQTKQKTPKQLTLIEKRRRAAELQRLLLQQKSLGQQDAMRDAQLQRLRRQQDNTLREQQDLQRRLMVQQNQAIRRMQNPPPVGQAQVPRLTPLDRPLIEQRNPSCGVPGMPLC